jgi:hypothetical protein
MMIAEDKSGGIKTKRERIVVAKSKKVRKKYRDRALQLLTGDN